MASVSPGGICKWRIPLKTVTPAQRRGAIAAGSIYGGIRTAASERRRQYSASMKGGGGGVNVDDLGILGIEIGLSGGFRGRSGEAKGFKEDKKKAYILHIG